LSHGMAHPAVSHALPPIRIVHPVLKKSTVCVPCTKHVLEPVVVM